MELLNKIYKDKFAFGALLVLAFLYIIILLADFIAPYSNYYSNRSMSYAPPSKIYTIDKNGHWSKPYTYNYIRGSGSWENNVETKDVTLYDYIPIYK